MESYKLLMNYVDLWKKEKYLPQLIFFYLNAEIQGKNMNQLGAYSGICLCKKLYKKTPKYYRTLPISTYTMTNYSTRKVY